MSNADHTPVHSLNLCDAIKLYACGSTLGQVMACRLDFRRDAIARVKHYNDVIISNQELHDCLLNRLFRRRSKETPKLRVTGLCAGNSPGTGEFPAQMASYAENVSIWCHHAKLIYCQLRPRGQNYDVMTWKRFPRYWPFVIGIHLLRDGWIPITKGQHRRHWCFLWCWPKYTGEQIFELPVIYETKWRSCDVTVMFPRRLLLFYPTITASTTA